MPLVITRRDITKMHVDAVVDVTHWKPSNHVGDDYATQTGVRKVLNRVYDSVPLPEMMLSKIVNARGLNSKYVIHTPASIWIDGEYGKEAKIRYCYLQVLLKAFCYSCRTVAFPLISPDDPDCPRDGILQAAVKVITRFLLNHEITVYLCISDKKAYSFSQRLIEDILDFISDNYAGIHDRWLGHSFDGRYGRSSSVLHCDSISEKLLPNRDASYTEIKEVSEDPVEVPDRSFAEILLDLIKKSRMSELACYRRANITRQVYLKIRTDKLYKPTKQVAVALAITLRLNLENTQMLLASAGLTLSKSNMFDLVIRYFIHNKIYDIWQINETLFELDQVQLGSL